MECGRIKRQLVGKPGLWEELKKRCQQQGLEREQQADEAQLMQDERLL